MKPIRKIKKTKAVLDLPAQRIWKEVQEYGVESSNSENAKNPKEKGDLLDQAFALLLNQLIRQN